MTLDIKNLEKLFNVYYVSSGELIHTKYKFQIYKDKSYINIFINDYSVEYHLYISQYMVLQCDTCTIQMSNKIVKFNNNIDFNVVLGKVIRILNMIIYFAGIFLSLKFYSLSSVCIELY